MFVENYFVDYNFCVEHNIYHTLAYYFIMKYLLFINYGFGEYYLHQVLHFLILIYYCR